MSDFRPGDAVLTQYGVGVITSLRVDRVEVRLWRICGGSVASSAHGVLRLSAILEKLPVTPGQLTRLKDGTKVMVHGFSNDRRTYTVSHVLAAEARTSISSFDLDEMISMKLQEYPVSSLQPAASSKFYGMLLALTQRADNLEHGAARFLSNQQDNIEKITRQAKDLQSSGRQLIGESSASPEDIVGKVTAQVQDAKLDESMKQILKMVKDEELTTLLALSRQRLQQLVRTDLARTTQASLEKSGIHIRSASFATSIDESRKVALMALEDVLSKAQLEDLHHVKDDLERQFGRAFDSLTTAAKSDPTLNKVFEDLNEKTTEWQNATGRLMKTRSAGLFMEGATRLTQRAAALLEQQNFQWAGEIGTKLTKSFTEGDAALARLKGVELGESVKLRLVKAIEARSESTGGLDGIIAGALASVKSKASGSDDQLKNLLSNLRNRASSQSLDARESLISVLSNRSQYRDVALLRLEQVFCDLESFFGDELKPEQLSEIVRGERGTAELFEPVAKRAMKQIDTQLSVAETQVEDKTTLEVLERVRKIMSGELSVSALTDDLVKLLDDEKVYATGQTIVQHGEHVLDALEGVSGSGAMDGAMQIVEQAGISTESVMKELEKLDVNQLLDDAGSAVSDEKARRRLVSSATDAALDFVLKILPSMPVPPFEGVSDGLVYHISNLSMAGFKVKKENIHIQLAGMRATKVPGSPASDTAGADDMQIEEVEGGVRATELLIIDVRTISAVLSDAVWSFEQTYLPYLKGNGLANVAVSRGAIRLQFELRKKRSIKDDSFAWEPVLCLHDRSCAIEEVDLSLDGEGSLTWILNKLAGIFKGPLRDFIVSRIVRVVTKQSAWILERLNNLLSPYWELILRTAKLSIEDLVEATEESIIRSAPSSDRTRIELVWRERLPLGLNLLMNDKSGLLKVVDFPRGSQARNVCEQRNLDPDLFKGATIVAVNGREFDERQETFEALKDRGRPKTVRFELADSESAERVRRFVEGPTTEALGPTKREFQYKTVTFTELGNLGIEFTRTVDNVGLAVGRFVEGEGGTVNLAERDGNINLGDLLTHINGKSVSGTGKDSYGMAINELEQFGTSRPLTLTFVEPYMHMALIEKPLLTPGQKDSSSPDELVLGQSKSTDGSMRISISGFKDIPGVAESSGVMIGDHLCFINAIPVGAGCRWIEDPSRPSLDEINAMLDNDGFYPIGLTFARPRRKGSRWERSPTEFSDSEADTICVTADHKRMVGVFLQSTENHDVIVSDFQGVPGAFQIALQEFLDEYHRLHLSIEWLNGQFVPSYASKLMVRNAMSRAWKSSPQGVEMWLCDDEKKGWTDKFVQNDLD